MRKQIAAANWKMNLTLAQGETLMGEMKNASIEMGDDQQAVFAIPFPYLIPLQNQIKNLKNFFVAAQNCAAEKSGAYTGETSAEIIRSIEIPFVIIGHSERREYYNETNEILSKKLTLALANNLKPIFCCGEPFTIREANKQNEHIQTQLKESLFHLTDSEMSNFIIAYEPIWAIGTGLTASSAQAQEMHAHIRFVIAEKYGAAIADSISILYGGSVKASNAADIFSQADVDGGLVGGASLVATEFVTIIKSLKKG